MKESLKKLQKIFKKKKGSFVKLLFKMRAEDLKKNLND